MADWTVGEIVGQVVPEAIGGQSSLSVTLHLGDKNLTRKVRFDTVELLSWQSVVGKDKLNVVVKSCVKNYLQDRLAGESWLGGNRWDPESDGDNEIPINDWQLKTAYMKHTVSVCDWSKAS